MVFDDVDIRVDDDCGGVGVSVGDVMIVVALKELAKCEVYRKTEGFQVSRVSQRLEFNGEREREK